MRDPVAPGPDPSSTLCFLPGPAATDRRALLTVSSWRGLRRGLCRSRRSGGRRRLSSVALALPWRAVLQALRAQDSQFGRGRAVGVAVEVDGDGEGCDVGREALDVDRERRLRAAVAGRSYACGVDLVDELAFENGQIGIGVGLAGRTGKR